MFFLSQTRGGRTAIGLFAGAVLLAQQPEKAERSIASGQALLQKQQWTEAAAEFERAIRIAPVNAAAHLGLSLAQRGAGQRAKAIAEAKTALKLRPAYPEARIALGLLLQQQGDTDGAIAQYKLLLKTNPRSAEGHNWLGVAFMQKSRLPDAAAEFRTAIRLDPTFVRAYNNLGSTLAQAGEIGDAIAAFREGLKRSPDDLPLRLNLGTALRTSGDSENAAIELRAVLQRDAANPELHYQLGLALREKGESEAAIAEFETALALNPEYRDGYYALGKTLQQVAAVRKRQTITAPAGSGGMEALQRGLSFARKSDLPGAIEQLRKAVVLMPDSAEAQFNLGAALWYSGERAGSAKALDEALRLDPAAGPAYSLRGVCYRESGDLAAAQLMFQRAVAVSPDSPAGYFDLGVLFLRLKKLNSAVGQFEAGLNLPSAGGPPPDLEMAVRELRAAVSAQPVAEGYNVLGRMLGLAAAAGHEVIECFESAIRMQPDYAEAHNNLGLVYTQTGDDEKAIQAFREAIRLRPDFADAHANLGAILTVSDIPASIRELEKALDLQHGLLKAHYNLAIAYGLSPKHGPDKEIAEFRKLLALQADYPKADFSLGKALVRQGNTAEAIQHLERAVKLEPASGEAQYQLGLALSRAGRTQEAARWLNQGRQLVADSQRDQSVLLDLSEGKASLQKGELSEAIAKFRSAVMQRPDLAEAQFQLGVALARKNEAEAAGQALRKALELDPTRAAVRDMLQQLQKDDPAKMAVIEAQIREGRYADAQSLAKSYLEDRPQSSWGWYALGYSLFAQKQIGASINALARSLSLDAGNAEAHKVLGRDLMMIGRFAEARREFEVGEKYAPNSAEIPFNLGRLFSIEDQWAEARAAFERALKADPAYMEAWDGLGFALEALGDEVQALASYQKAAKLNGDRQGNFAAPYVNLSAYYNRKGDADTALEYARKAVGVNANADSGWFQMGRAHERRGELDAAADALNRAIAINGRASSYHYVLATIYRRLGKQKESRDAMEAFSRLDRESAELEQKRREGLHPDAPKHE